ncbi:MAG: S-layer protein domain-containing protein [Euryarchaeota archaeon]|nr:S-layer protein domain-containing protein [Euryarchaeota archaeon]
MAVSAVVDDNEIQGPTATVVDGETYTWGPQDFAGFYYDIDDNLGRESITMTITGGNALDEPGGIVYNTKAQEDDFEFDEWGRYYTIGFLAEEYFAGYVEAEADPKENSYLYDESEDENLMVDEQLSKILTDDDDEYTFTTGTPLKLAEGYELSIKAIDLDGNKVYVKLYKDGKSVDSAVIEPSTDNPTMEDKTYAYTRDLGDTEDIVVIAVHFKNAFRGAEQDLATVDGVWQISDTCADVEEDTEYGKMTIQTVNSDEGDMFIEMDNEDSKITLNKNKDTSLMEDIRIRTADQDDITAEDPLRFYIYKELTEPGTYEIRGNVADLGDTEFTWNTSNFVGFFYDIDDNLGRESITMTITEGNALDEPGGIVYNTEAQEDGFEFDEWGEYYTIGFLAEEYFAGYVEAEADPKENSYLYDESEDENLMVDEQLSKILTDDDEEYTFTTGTPLKLKEGYELSIKAIDLDGNKVYVELYKDGKSVDSAVVEPSMDNPTMEDKTYAYTRDLGDTEDIVVIAVHFKNAFRGAEQDLATVDGVWQISDTYADVEEDTEYNKMTIQTVNSDEGDMFIEMDNEDNKITLNKNKDTLLMENIRIKTADQTSTAEDPLRFYIYEELVIEGEEEVAPEPVVSEPVVEEPVVEEPVEEEAVVEEPVEEEAVVEEPVEEEPAEDNGGIPGFEAVFAITGLLAVSYLVLRRRD